MPQAVGAVIAKVVTVGVALLKAEGLKGAIARFVGLVLLSSVVRKFAGKPRVEDLAGVRLANSSNPIEPRKIIYGTARVGGLIFFFDTSGTDNEFLWYGIALASHECEAINTVYFDNVPIVNGEIDGSGNVIAGTYNGRVLIKKHLGTDAQTVDTDLEAAFGNWNTNDRGRGVCYVIIRLQRDDDNEDNPVFPDGPPRSITCEVQGRKVYDPRIGGHLANDSSTWAWSDNPALCTRDFLAWDQFGYGIPYQNIIESKVTSAANVCEESVEVQSGTFQDRYTCNGLLTTDTRIGNTRRDLVDSMTGKAFESQGLWHIHAGEYDVPSFSLDEDDFVGSIQLQATAPKKDRYNSTQAVFIDSNNNFQPATSTPMEDATYITDDGEKIPNRIDLPLTDNHFGAQIISLLHNKQSRNQVIFTAEMMPSAIRFGMWDTVDVTFADFSWTNKVFRVVGWGLSGRGLPTITFREETSTAYDSVFGDFVAPQAVPGQTFNRDIPSTASNLVATGVIGGTKLTWDNPPASEYARIELFFNATNNFAVNGGDPAATIIAKGDFNSFTHETQTPYFYWVRVRAKNGNTVVFPTGDPGTGIYGVPLGDPLSPLFYNGFEPLEFGDWVIAAGETGTLVADSTTVFAGSQSGAMDSTVAAPSSSGLTGSHYVAIPEEVALAFAGQTVVVSVVARKALATPSTQFALAYSTNDNGDSGWQNFNPTTTFTKFSFEYVVPLPIAGGPDYIGIHPDTSGAGLDLIVDAVSVLVKGADGVTGPAGGDGKSVFVGNVYLRKATAPTAPIADDGSYNFSTSTLTAPSVAGGSADNWFTTVPSGSDPLYVVSGQFEIIGSTGTDSTVAWSAPTILASDGATGPAGGDGNSVHVGQVFLRKPTAPTTPIADDGSYNFGTNVLTAPSISGGSADNWSTAVPVGGDPLYVSQGTFEINGTAGTDSTVVWSAPTLLVSDGLSSVPDFTPGFIGGISDFVFTLNAINGGAANDGEIRIEGTTFEHPDGTTITTDVSDFALHTPYEGAVKGRFYIMFSATVFETRFGGVAGDWGAGDDTRFGVVTYDDANGWRARNNSGTYFTFTPLVTDCIIAACEKVSGSGGIETIVSFLAGLAGTDGAAGGDGNSVFVGQVFLRKATAPSTPVTDDGAYNFGTNVLTAPSTGGGSADNWSTTVPSGSDPLYVSTGTFEINGTVGTDSTVIWSAPVILASDGADGAVGGDGNSVHVAQAFLRKATAPTKPIDNDGSYNFSTTTLTPPSTGGGSADNWFTTVPSGTDPLYVVQGVFEINGTTGTDGTVVWSTPVILATDGATGPPGGDGNSVFVGQVFLRKASAPSTPVTDDGSYNFGTNVLTAPSTGGGSADNWSTTVPSGTDPLYVSAGTFEINGITGIDSTVVWSTPVILASDGTDGAVGGDGNSVHVASAFLRKATAPTKPIDNDGSYNFSTTTLTPPSISGGSADDWSTGVPSGSDPLYIVNGTFEINGIVGTDSTVVWSTPVILASDGANPVTGSLTNESAVIPTDGNGNNGDYSTAKGYFKVFEGVTEETANATFSEQGETAVTGTINTAVNTPVAGEPAGYYEVTDITSNNGVYSMRAVFGGVTIDKDFNLSRTIAPLGATIDGTKVQENVANGAVNPIPNSSKTCTPSGGTPAYTFSWVRVSGDTQLSAVSPTAQTTEFKSSGGTDELFSAIFRCDVDDSTGAGPAASNTFRLDVTHGTLP